METSELCKFIELKHHSRIPIIDILCKMPTGDEDFFNKLEKQLDYCGTVQFADYNKLTKYGCKKDLYETRDRYLLTATRKINSHIKTM